MSDRGQQDGPQGWKRTTLGEALPIHYGKARNEKYGIVREDTPVYGSSGKIDTFKRALTGGPSLIIGRKGTVGATYYCPEPCWPIDTVYFAEASADEDLRFFKYLLDHLQLARMDRSTAVPGLSRDDYNATGVFIPELDQQRLIVAEIEKQFSRLDEAVASLKRTKANLKRYKAAVLKAAVEGMLTEEWRKQHPDVEPASKLLERILTERRAKWNGRAGYSAPIQPDISNLPELPNGWVWVRLDTIAALKGGITVDKKRKSSTARTLPYLRVANVQRGYLDLSEVKEINAPEADIRDLRLEPGDILFNEGGDRDKLGRGWVWEGQLSECIHQNHVFRARLYLADVAPKLVSWWGNSFGQTYFLREGKQTTNLASINITKLSAFPIPFPPAAEQQQIVAEVERHLSVINELEATVEASLTRAERLRQSILSDAFSGNLVRLGRTRSRTGLPECEL